MTANAKAIACPRPLRIGARFAVAACLAACLLGGTALAQQQDGKKVPTYRWVDERGVVHYGDRIPPEYARRESAVLNRQGVAVSVRPAQKTPEQLALETEQRAIADREKQRDNFLLSTYTSVRDIENLRDQRVQQMIYARRSTEAYIESLNGRLSTLQQRAQVFRPYNESPGARRMPDELAADIVRTMNEVSAQRAQMAERQAEERTVREQFQVDIERYKGLKAKLANR